MEGSHSREWCTGAHTRQDRLLHTSEGLRKMNEQSVPRDERNLDYK